MNNPSGTAQPVPSPQPEPSTGSGKPPPARTLDVWATRLVGLLLALPHHVARHWPWLLIAAAYILAWWLPFSWSIEVWRSPHHIEFFQPWLPLAVLFLVYARRDQLKEAWVRSQRKSRTVRLSTWQRGNASIVVLGCLLLLGLHLIQVKGLSVIALIVIAIGVIYQIYGWRVVRAMGAPILLLCLMVPLPDSPLQMLNDRISTLNFQLLAQLLARLHHPVLVTGASVRFLSNNFTVDFGTIVLGTNSVGAPSGLDVIVGTMLAMLIYGLYKRYASVRIVGSLLVGVVVAASLNIARLLVAALLAERSPSIGERLKDYNTLLMILAASLVTGLLVRLITRAWLKLFATAPGSRRRSPFQIFLQALGFVVSLPFLPIVFLLGFATRAGGGVSHAAKRSEMRTERVLHSVSPVARVFLIPFTLWRRSERGIEKLFRRFTKKRRDRRSGFRHY